MGTELTIRWLGIAGLELSCGGETVLIDPVFSRVPLRRVLFGRVAPDREAVRRHATAAAAIFITHAHHDHLMDAPALSAMTGADLYAPANGCAIARACGADPARLHVLAPGDTVTTNEFSVTALRATHLRLPGFGPGEVGRLSPPLRARQYRLDESLVFRVRAGSTSLLAGPGLCLGDPGPVDVLLCCPIYLGRRLPDYLARIRPRAFAPIHWEDLFRPADGTLRPGLVPRVPLRRLDMERVARQTSAQGVRYMLLTRDREYAAAELTGERAAFGQGNSICFY